MMSEHGLDEAVRDSGRAVRVMVMMGAQLAERAARTAAEAQRRSAERAREEAREATAAARDITAREREAVTAAREAYMPVADPRGFQQATPETAAAAWTSAQAWSDRDPQAQAAAEAIYEMGRERWGQDWPAREETDRATDPATVSDRDSAFQDAMDQDWRSSAEDVQLQQVWSMAIDAGNEPGAPEARAAVEAEMATRLGVDVEDYVNRLDPDTREVVDGALDDAQAAGDDQRAEAANERAAAAAWTAQADVEEAREGGADDAGDNEQAHEHSAHALGNEGVAAGHAARAPEADGEASRVDRAAIMDAPAAAREARVRTAPAFGRTTVAGVTASKTPRARKNVARGADRSHDVER